MSGCLVIVGGWSVRDAMVHRAAMAFAQRASMELVMVEPKQEVPERTLADVIDSGALCAITNYLKELPAEEPLRDWTEEILQGIADCVAELQHRVGQTLARYGSRRHKAVRNIFQPCWRAERWKSLT